MTTYVAVPALSMMSVEEAGFHLGLNERSVWRLIQDGELPSYEVLGQVRLKFADVEKFANSKPRPSGLRPNPAEKDAEHVPSRSHRS